MYMCAYNASWFFQETLSVEKRKFVYYIIARIGENGNKIKRLYFSKKNFIYMSILA